jgi:osmotically-inducible protein OsmY
VKEFFIGLITGAVLMAATGWYYTAHKTPAVRHAQDVTANAIQNAVDATAAKLQAWHLTNRDIEAELTKTGKVVRRQMSDFGTAVADAAGDTRITAKIKTKLALDKDLSGFSISVSTTDGNVTLSGNVTSYDQIGKAMLVARETEGVRDVASTLRIKPKAS